MTGRLLAELAEVFLRDAAAAVDPRWTPDDREGMPPTREITLDHVGESRRLVGIATELELRAAFAGFNAYADDPFESAEELERRRCEAWDRIL